jgi:nucleotide-binding universal stress UspA family protein
MKHFPDFRKIVVALDLSDTSYNTLDYAAQFCAAAGVRHLELLHVFMGVPDANGRILMMSHAEQARRSSDMEALKEKVGIPPQIQVTTRIVPGEIAETLIDYSKDDATDLIIMGANRRRDTISRMLGSASTVLTHAHCPVLLVPAHAYWRPIHRILVGGDVNDPSYDTPIENAGLLAEKLGAELHIVHVQDMEHPEAYREAKLKMAFDQKSVSVEMATINDDNVTHGLEKYAWQHEIDLLTTVTKRRTTWEALWHRSVTRALSEQEHELPLLVLYK